MKTDTVTIFSVSVLRTPPTLKPCDQLKSNLGRQPSRHAVVCSVKKNDNNSYNHYKKSITQMKSWKTFCSNWRANSANIYRLDLLFFKPNKSHCHSKNRNRTYWSRSSMQPTRKNQKLIFLEFNNINRMTHKL